MLWLIPFLHVALAAAVASATSTDSRVVKLNNGVIMPVVSLGTAGLNDEAVEGEIVKAAAVGFQALDTAFNYYNQNGVGAALRRVNRSSIFVITKTSPCVHPNAPPRQNITDVDKCQQQTRSDIESDLEQLKLDKIDLLLLHGANHHGEGTCGELACRLNIAQWKVYEEYYAAGKVRAIGVSNFCPSCLDCVLNTAKVIPAVNQVRYHVGMTADPEGLMSYSKAHGIVPMAYAPMGKAENLFKDPTLLKIGAAHNKSAAQVALKWIVAKGYTLATEANSEEHLREDLDLFSWELGNDEVSALDVYSKGTDVPSWACTAALEDSTVMQSRSMLV